MNLLIDKSVLLSYANLSSSSQNIEIYEQCIREAQTSDLRLLMGEAFFYDFNINISQQKYLYLFNETQYTGLDSNKYISFGLKAVLAHYAIARYLMFNQISDTPFGFMQKTTDFAQPINWAQQKQLVAERRQLGLDAWETVKLFILTKISDYPLFYCQNKQPRQELSIKKIY